MLDDAMVDLMASPFDLVVRAGPLPDSSLMARKLCDVGLVLCASPRYLRHNEEPTTPAELAGHEFALYTPLGNPMQLVLTAADGQPQTVAVHGRMRSNNADALAAMARSGSALTVLPSRWSRPCSTRATCG